MNELYDFKQRVLEEELFNKLKDAPVMTSHYMRKRYKSINVTRLRTRIINYQIDVYGETIGINEKLTKEEVKEKNMRNAQKDRQRWYYRRNKNV